MDKVDGALEILLPTLREKWIGQTSTTVMAEKYAQKEGADLVKQLNQHYFGIMCECLETVVLHEGDNEAIKQSLKQKLGITDNKPQ